MTDVRCVKCGTLLGRIDGHYEIKCRKCKAINSNIKGAIDKYTHKVYNDTK